ncbi:MAG: S46 family peptidase [Alphaproteobacteria bacterium]|nr:S46 family peptidase [Alphaproteobacteria bacterium]
MILSLALTLTAPAQADEGMWLPEQLPAMAETLAEMGLELPAEQLADPLSAPLGAVISLGGCSASFVSDQGLIATNHHCVSGYLQYNSDGEQNRARDGYLAPDRASELSAGPTARVQVVESIEDVTDRVNARIRRRTKDLQRAELVEAAIKEIVAECEQAPDRRCRVVDVYAGQQYRLITALELQDLRVVYAPPRSVGDYGGEVDNWEWPRHGGDFSLLRAYVAPDGSAAPFAEENVPYQPKHHLRIATGDLDPGDFVMVAGYPWETYRHHSALELRFDHEVGYPFWIDLLQRELDILEEESAASAQAAARLADPIDGTSNFLKYCEGMQDNFSRPGALEPKLQEDAALRAWIDELPARQERHGAALSEQDALITKGQASFRRDTLVGGLFWASDLLSAAHKAYRLSVEREKPDLKREFGYQERDEERLRQRLEQMERALWLPAERRLLELMLTELAALPPEQQVPELSAWLAAQGGMAAALERLYDDPELAETEARLALLEADRATLEASEDPWVQLAVALEAHLAPKRFADKVDAGARLRVDPVVMEALIASRGGLVYPDANGTLRVTVGHVQGYSPRDAVQYLPQTTLPGVVAKAGEEPFDAPARLLEAAGAPGERWVDPDLGEVPVDFLTTLDTTGGNSGSATLNGRGELVGLIFDGNYESMSADWTFNPSITRSIHVDVRYILWLLDEVEGAEHLLTELGVDP